MVHRQYNGPETVQWPMDSTMAHRQYTMAHRQYTMAHRQYNGRYNNNYYYCLFIYLFRASLQIKTIYSKALDT